MSKYSRVKKYAALRDEITNERVLDYETKEVKLTTDKDSAGKHLYKQQEVKTDPKQLVQTTSFKDEYLQDFIKEAKQYNMDRGLREVENTQINILNSINPIIANPEEANAEEETAVEITQELSLEEAVQSFEEDSVITSSEIDSEGLAALIDDINNNEKEELAPSDEMVFDTAEIVVEPHSKGNNNSMTAYFESLDTTELPVEKEVKAVEKTIEHHVSVEEEKAPKNNSVLNNVLNVVLGLLIVLMILLMGVLVWWFLSNGGI